VEEEEDEEDACEYSCASLTGEGEEEEGRTTEAKTGKAKVRKWKCFMHCSG
jgi:hypothetical protein